ncbi:sugar transferase [Levilactobacillus tongjiangensis]|uniref:Sugar transferase n=1 Tax=Levilactobacillus tongjiangensis TaxID=2486023 RepID=A0ABW1SUL1_9LACO|nr:sugar transferase [Levilactobacillus tongjiangensis]
MDYRDTNYQSSSLDQARQRRRYLYRTSKRVFDMMMSLLGLLLLMPVFIVVALLIKLEDPRGPVFYSQTRVGVNQRPFRMFKFRSMVADADHQLNQLLQRSDVAGAMFKMKQDLRITKIGRVIRKYSVDELPQLLNVLLGQMSLVGPRPPLPREVATYTSHDLQRLTVKPGCTGLWQATVRNEVSFAEMVLLDLQYIARRSFLLDLYVLLLTIRVFVKPNGAY